MNEHSGPEMKLYLPHSQVSISLLLLEGIPTGNSVNELQYVKSQDFPSFCPRNRPLRLLGYGIHTHNENHKFKIIIRNP